LHARPHILSTEGHIFAITRATLQQGRDQRGWAVPTAVPGAGAGAALAEEAARLHELEALYAQIEELEATNGGGTTAARLVVMHARLEALVDAASESQLAAMSGAAVTATAEAEADALLPPLPLGADTSRAPVDRLGEWGHQPRGISPLSYDPKYVPRLSDTE
jgi:hypothetical protein